MFRFLFRVVLISSIFLSVFSYGDILKYFSSFDISFTSLLADINQSGDLYLTEKEMEISGLPYKDNAVKKEGKLFRVPLDDILLYHYRNELEGSPYGQSTPKEIGEYLASVDKQFSSNRTKEFQEWISGQRKWLNDYSAWFAKAKKGLRDDLRKSVRDTVSKRLSVKRAEASGSIERKAIWSFALAVALCFLISFFSRGGGIKSTPFRMEKASGTWASTSEIFKRFLIYKKSTIYFVSAFSFLLLSSVFFFFTESFLVLLGSIPVFFFTYYAIRSSTNYFPLGKSLKGPFRIGLKGADRFTHTLVCAPTGAYKTSSIIVPGLLQDSLSDGSAMVIDVKSPEIFNDVAGAWISRGKKVILFDPWHPNCIGFNPLYKASDDELNTIVKAFMGDPPKVAEDQRFFRGRTDQLLYSMFKLVQTFPERLCNLSVVYLFASNVPDLIHHINLCRDVKVKSLFKDFTLLSNDQKINMLSSVREKLQMFRDEAVQSAFSRSDFDLSILFREKEPALLIIGTPEDKEQLGSLIASLMARLVLLRAFEETRLQKQKDEKKGDVFFKPNHLYLYLDEFPSLNIPGIAKKIRTARYTNTQLIICVQDLSELEALYTDYKSILANLRTQLYLSGCEIKTCEYIALRLGKTRTPTQRYSKPLFSLWPGSKFKQWEEDLLMSPDSIQNLPPDLALCFAPHTRPFLLNLQSQHNSAEIKKMIIPLNDELKPYRPNPEPLSPPSIPFKDDIITGTGKTEDEKAYQEWTIGQSQAGKENQAKRKRAGGSSTFDRREFYGNDPVGTPTSFEPD